METPSSRLKDQVIVPIALLVVVAMAIVVGLAWFSARAQDDSALERSRDAFSTALERQRNKLGFTALDFSWWDDAVRNLAHQLNVSWANENVGFYIHDVHGFELTLVVDGDDRTIYEQIDGARAPEIDAFEVLTPELHALVEETRAAPVAQPAAATGFLPWGGGIAVVGASAVAPHEPGSVELPPGPRVVLVFAKRLDQALLDSLADPLPLSEPRLTTDPGTGHHSGAVLPITAPDREILGQLSWRPNQPGRQFLASVAPALAGAIAIVLIFTTLVLRHARLATGAIEASEARFKDVADASSDWIWETDRDFRLTYLSSSFADATGMPLRLQVGVPFNELFHAAESAEAWQAHLGELASWRPFRNVLYLCEDLEGLTRTVRVSGKPVFDAAGRPQGFRGTATDITTEIEAGRRAEFLARHDPLTGLPNRSLLNERLEQAVAGVSRRGDHAALILIDMDHFKDVNDTLGHPAGDLLLQACADRLSACVRELDTVARIGGDEFAIVQTSIAGPADASQLCERIMRAFRMPFELDGNDVLTSVSIGCALVPTDGSIPDKLLQNADIALYRAKEEGRNAARFFEPEMDARLQQRKALERELRQAITRGELELYFQPKIALGKRRLIGVEALVRWNHPQRGLIPPGDFIPVAEETGLIVDVGEWVLREACRRGCAWPDLHIAVNISSVQFRQTNLVALIQSVLAETGLPAHQLELELTESVLISQPKASADVLEGLKRLGVRIAMDDFGTGYSSLSYLHRFPFDKIKVDRSFTHMLGVEAAAAAVVRAVINIARDLGMSTCAEGVEKEAQADLLEREGCDEVQGFLFGRPMPVPAFEAYRHTWMEQGDPCRMAHEPERELALQS